MILHFTPLTFLTVVLVATFGVGLLVGFFVGFFVGFLVGAFVAVGLGEESVVRDCFT